MKNIILIWVKKKFLKKIYNFFLLLDSNLIIGIYIKDNFIKINLMVYTNDIMARIINLIEKIIKCIVMV